MSRYEYVGEYGGEEVECAFGKDHTMGWFFQICTQDAETGKFEWDPEGVVVDEDHMFTGLTARGVADWLQETRAPSHAMKEFYGV